MSDKEDDKLNINDENSQSENGNQPEIDNKEQPQGEENQK